MAAQHIGNRCRTEIQSLDKRGQVASNSDSSNKLCISFARMARVPIDPGRTLLTRRFDKRHCQLGGGHPACLLSHPEHSINTPRQRPL